MIGLLFFACFFCCGLRLITHKDLGLILSFAGKWLDKQRKILKILSKPILTCASCMASVWGAIFFHSFIGITPDNIFRLILFMIALSFINTLTFIIFYYYYDLYSQIIQSQEKDTEA